MADKSKIEWTDATWNPTRGCSRLSPGCGGANHQGGCYAEKIAARFSGPGQPFNGFARRTKHGGAWTGKLAVAWEAIDVPIRWRKPRRIFVNSMSDLFHPALPLDEVAVIYGTAIAAVHLRGHVLQILTKRGDRMRELLNSEEFWEIANAHAESLVLEHVDPLDRRSDDARATCDDYGPDKPPPGIWLGVSVEDQERARERIPQLLASPAAVRFLSCEPLLGPLDLTTISQTVAPGFFGDALRWYHRGKCHEDEGLAYPSISWVIAGGESGPRARPSHPDWFRSLRDQCASAGVPFFFKQWGEWAPGECADFAMTRSEHVASLDAEDGSSWTFEKLTPRQSEEMHHDDGPDVFRIGKRRSGAKLDGVEHRAMPA